MTYDEAIKRVELIVHELEQTEALSVADYQKKAKEAKELLNFCQSQLVEMERTLANSEE